MHGVDVDDGKIIAPGLMRQRAPLTRRVTQLQSIAYGLQRRFFEVLTIPPLNSSTTRRNEKETAKKRYLDTV